MDWTYEAWWDARVIDGPTVDHDDRQLRRRAKRADAFVSSRPARIYPDRSLIDQFRYDLSGPEFVYRLPSGRLLDVTYKHPWHNQVSLTLSSPEGDILAVGFVWEDSGRWLRQPGQTDWLPPGSAAPIEKNDRLEGEYHLTILVRPDTSRDDYVRTLSAWAKAKWRISESPEIWWL
ncbi:MAG: hypothetical protein EOP66_00860 [Sphingomonas sp.]|nr:MAG: hypothetical protein EOP66_00860 [Sphingomonas sp.]